MNIILFVIGSIILLLVIGYILVRLWYNKPASDYKKSDEFKKRREDFIEQIKKSKK